MVILIFIILLIPAFYLGNSHQFFKSCYVFFCPLIVFLYLRHKDGSSSRNTQDLISILIEKSLHLARGHNIGSSNLVDKSKKNRFLRLVEDLLDCCHTSERAYQVLRIIETNLINDTLKPNDYSILAELKGNLKNNLSHFSDLRDYYCYVFLSYKNIFSVLLSLLFFILSIYGLLNLFVWLGYKFLFLPFFGVIAFYISTLIDRNYAMFSFLGMQHLGVSTCILFHITFLTTF